MTNMANNSPLPETECPSLEELPAQGSKAVGQLALHLNECPRCRARLAMLNASDDTPPVEVTPPAGEAGLRSTPQRVRPETRLDFGVICSIASDQRPGERLLAVVVGGPAVKDPAIDAPLTVAPISIDSEYASQWDALLAASELDLGYECMVEVWNYGRVARVQLDESFGRVNPAACRRLQGLWEALRGRQEEPHGVERVGPAILSEVDPRVAFQSDEIARVRDFYTPHVDSVRELAGSFVRLLQERARLVAFSEPSPGTIEAEVLTAVRGNGFVTPPESHALGRVVKLLAVDVSEGSVGVAALEEEASAWLENERNDSTQLAARGAFERARVAVGRIIPALAPRGIEEDTAIYVADVVASASSGGLPPTGPH